MILRHHKAVVHTRERPRVTIVLVVVAIDVCVCVCLSAWLQAKLEARLAKRRAAMEKKMSELASFTQLLETGLEREGISASNAATVCLGFVSSDFVVKVYSVDRTSKLGLPRQAEDSTVGESGRAIFGTGRWRRG
eukprot:COSAG06_NODE_1336_length_9822_cov_2.335905_11_plen_135_part_00